METEISRLVAAGVVLRGDQDQAGPGRNRLRPGRSSKGEQDSGDGEVGGEDAESDRGDYGEEEDQGHEEYGHDESNL